MKTDPLDLNILKNTLKNLTFEIMMHVRKHVGAETICKREIMPTLQDFYAV